MEEAQEGTSSQRNLKEPAVIRFGFKQLKRLDGDKWAATCVYCNTVLTDRYRTTSTFTK